MAMSVLLTIKEVAERLQISPATVYLLCNQKKLAHVRVGGGRGTIRIKQEDLEAFIETCRVAPGAEREVPTKAPPAPPQHKLKHLSLS